MTLPCWTYLVLFAAGLLAGLIDAMAGGGGLISLPVLLWVGVPPKIALGTNKLQSSCGTALAAWRYGRAGLLRWRDLRLGLCITFLSAMAGAMTVTRLESDILRQIIPPILVGLAVWFWLQPRLGLNRQTARMRPMVFAILFGGVLGFYDGFFGPGTGSFWMLACLFLLGLDLREATGHTKAMNLASNLASLAVFVASGSVRYDIGVVMIVGQLIGARLGSGLVITHGARFIRPIFLAVVVTLAARLLWENLAR
jgi:uncharacterized protein